MPKKVLVIVVAAVVVIGGFLLLKPKSASPWDKIPSYRPHLDHASFFPDPIASGQEATKQCLTCHPDSSKEVMATAHFQWLGDTMQNPRTGQEIKVGKKNLINNFCIGIDGNWPSCTRCHAGYGWSDDKYDFDEQTNVDCLVCHDRTGTYKKGPSGMPAKDVDLQAVAKSVGFPRRDNCGGCHHYGGGGLGVKHGDLDATLDNPNDYDDVHMGRHNMLCIDCHGGKKHQIMGKGYSVSVNPQNGIACTDCHEEKPHADSRINDHTDAVACQTCHIPTFANRVPTKMVWDWSKAGDDSRKDDVHNYLKIKGEFVYDSAVIPAYEWFDMTVDRYLLGGTIDDTKMVDLNRPRGQRGSPGAKIWPFKLHLAKQPYDKESKMLIPPVTAGKGGYWHEFDWDKAMGMGAKLVGLEYSGQLGFVETRMHWPLSHMVVPAEQALQCNDCHSQGGRMDWKALGYGADPMDVGGRGK